MNYSKPDIEYFLCMYIYTHNVYYCDLNAHDKHSGVIWIQFKNCRYFGCMMIHQPEQVKKKKDNIAN